MWVNNTENKENRDDQTKVFKIKHGCDDTYKEIFIKLKDKIITREHRKVLVKNHCRLDVRKCALSHRTVKFWSKLPGSCVNATSVNRFKSGIDNYCQGAGYI